MSDDWNILSVTDLQISFGGAVAVDKVSFELGKSDTLAVVGESGSGKSLTAMSMMGLLPTAATMSGRINFAGSQIDESTDWGNIRGSSIGMIFQEPMSSLNPVMQIGQQITESIILHQKLNERQAKKQTLAWLEKVMLPEPQRIYKRYPHELSGGQKQRVMIAMAMCNNPSLLIADEPTTALDVTVQKEVLQLMQDLQRQEGMAMIFITHDLALAAQIANKVLVMHKGKVVEQGASESVLTNPQADYTKALLACRPSPEDKGKRLAIVSDFLDNENLKKEVSTTQHQISKDALLQVNGLRVWFEQGRNWGKPAAYFKAVDDVSFQIKKGEVLGLVGESGCGKSTISKSLMGLLPIYEGEASFGGKDLSSLSAAEWRAVRKDIQLIFQDPYASLNPRMSVGDMLLEPLSVHKVVAKNERSKEVARLLELVQLPADSVKRYPHQFSGGQRQRLGIARALAVRPKLLICDESVSALDVSVQAQILNLLKDLQTELNLTYLFISHDLNVVHYISDRVMVMQAGKLVEQGAASDVLKTPQNDYTKKLIDAMP